MLIDNLKISTKITAVILLIAAASFASLGYLCYQLQAVNDTYVDQIKRIDVAIASSESANRLLTSYGRTAYMLATEFTATGNQGKLTELESVEQEVNTIWAHVLQALPEYKEQISPVTLAVKDSIDQCEGSVFEAAKTANSDEVLKASLRLKSECDPGLSKAIAMSIKLSSYLVDKAARNADELSKKASEATVFAVVNSLIGLSLMVILGIFFAVKEISQPLTRLSKVMESFAKKDFTVEVPGLHRLDELGALAQAAEVLRIEATEMETQRFIQTQLAQLAQDLQAVTTYADLSKRLFTNLAPLLQIGQASLYRMDEDRTGLLLCGGYARTGELLPGARIDMGEGLVGQCAIDGDTLVIDSPPEDYLRIVSGLGSGAPATLVLIPVKSNHKLVGVIEVATMSPLLGTGSKLLQNVVPIVALTLEIIDRNVRAQGLLEAASRVRA